MIMQQRRLYGVSEAAAQLSLSRTSLYELFKTGDLESITIGRKRLVPADSLDRYIERLRAGWEQ